MADFNEIIDSIKKEFGNTDSQLDRAIENDKLWKLAGLLGSHVPYIGEPGFELNEADKAELKRTAWMDGDQEAMKHALIKWRKKTRSNCFTYKSLIKILNSLAKDQCKGQIATGFKCSLYWMLACTVVLIGILSIVILQPNFYREGFIPSAKQSSKTAGTTVGNALSLPPRPEIFVGREDDMQKLLSKLNFESNETGIIGIVGSPGFGKSTLANELGHRLAYQGVNVYYVDFGDFMKGDVQLYLAEKILPEIEEKPSFNKLLKWAKNVTEKMVVIVDNCDVMFQAQDAESTFTKAIKKLVQISESIKVVTTSIKSVIHLQHTIETFSLNASILFLDRKLQHSSVKISFKEKEEIANLTGNVPLALDIVGSLLNLRDSLSPETIINDLKLDPISLLNPPEVLVQSRINASISLAFKYLDDHVKEVASFLSLFPGSFDRNASKEISKKLDEANMSNLVIVDNDLRILVTLSLLEFNKTGQGRYHYHRLIQEFFKKRKLTNNLSQNFKAQFCGYYLNELYKHTMQFNQRFVDSLKFLDSEGHNIKEILSANLMLENENQCPRPAPSSFETISQLEILIYAIEKGYITRRFAVSEILNFLNSLLYFLENQFQLAQYHDDPDIRSNETEFTNQNHVMLLRAIADLLAKTEGPKEAIDFMEQRTSFVDSLFMDTEARCCSVSNLEKCKHIKSESTCRDSTIVHLERQKTLFYHLLNRYYDETGQHSKIRKDCFQGYMDIGLMYMRRNEPVDAAKYFELSLQYNSGETKIFALRHLFLVYMQIEGLSKTQLEPHLMSKELNHTAERMLLEIPKLNRNQKIDILRLIMDIIILLSNIVPRYKLNLLEENLFSIITPDARKPFQLKPELALESIFAISHLNNDTKAILWGSHLLKAFNGSYDTFSPEDKEIILNIRYFIANAHMNIALQFSLEKAFNEPKLKKEYIKGCKEIYYIFKAETRNPIQHCMHQHVNVGESHCRLVHICYSYLKRKIPNFAAEVSQPSEIKNNFQDMYMGIGISYMFDKKPVDAAKYFELSLENNLGVENKITALHLLFVAYLQIEGLSEIQLKPHLMSKKLNNTSDRILLELPKLNRTQIITHWYLIKKLMPKINEANFREKLFSLIYDPRKPFQVEPELAKEIVAVFNGTEIILLGSQFLKKFGAFCFIFPPEDIAHILYIHFLKSEAHFGQKQKEHVIKGCKGMQHVCETANTNQDLQLYYQALCQADYKTESVYVECPHGGERCFSYCYMIDLACSYACSCACSCASSLWL